VPLDPGVRLGPYEIIAALGAGGMGEVYRARDARLERDVALKVLPASMSADEERLRRFTFEAQSAGGLNHPNILTIYDVGSEPSTGSGPPVVYLVTELLEGETLREKLNAGALPRSKAIAWARQTAAGLAAAHARGITHRDIKPENLFVTTDGRLKILDFGLARAAAPAAASGESSSDDATRLEQITSAGMVLGTAGYMSPEQVRAQPVDSRSDIFSLGVVLYEMLSGRRPFTGDSAVETMNAILTTDPPELTAASSSDRSVPPAVQQVVAHCLEKNPEERFQSARDLAFALEALSSSSTATGAEAALDAPARAPAARRELFPYLAIALAVIAGLLGAALVLTPGGGADLGRYRFRALATDPAVEQSPAWSPDGTAIAYTREVDGVMQLFLREPGVDEPVQLTRSEGQITQPFWWPDSSRLGVIVDGELMTVSRAGGEPAAWFDDGGGLGAVQTAALSPDGARLALWAVDPATRTTSIYLSEPADSTPQRYEPAPFAQACCTGPNVLRFAPDGRSLIFSHFGLGNSGRVAVWLVPMPGDGGEPREVFAGHRLRSVPSWSWLPDGRHLIAGLDAVDAPATGLWIADVERETLTPISVGLDGQDSPSVSPDGSQIAFEAGGPDFDLVAFPLDPSAPVANVLATSRNEYSAAWTTGSRRFVYVTDRNGIRELRLRSDADGSDRSLVTADQFDVSATTDPIGAPIVSPDGRRVAYHVIGTGGAVAIWLSPMSGGTPTRLMEGNVPHGAPTWSPDGQRLALWQLSGALAVIDVGRRDSAPRTIAEGVHPTPLPAWSPGGEWIAYVDNAGLHLVSPDGEPSRKLVDTADIGIAWSPDSATIYTFDSAARLLVAIDTGTGRISTVRALGRDVSFGVPSNPSQRFSISPDGRSLMATIVHVNTDIWILEGFPRPRGLMSRVFGARSQ
jgi:Tol biopolymer transport system component